MLGFMAIGAGCGLTMVTQLDLIFDGSELLGWKIFRGIWIIISMYLAMFLQMFIHEGGHLVFGLLTGYRFSSFRIASLMLLKENGSYHWKKLSLAGTGGQCLMCPHDLVDGKIRYVVYNFSGVFFTLISAVLPVIPDFCVFLLPWQQIL